MPADEFPFTSIDLNTSDKDWIYVCDWCGTLIFERFHYWNGLDRHDNPSMLTKHMLKCPESPHAVRPKTVKRMVGRRLMEYEAEALTEDRLRPA